MSVNKQYPTNINPINITLNLPSDIQPQYSIRLTLTIKCSVGKQTTKHKLSSISQCSTKKQTTTIHKNTSHNPKSNNPKRHNPDDQPLKFPDGELGQKLKNLIKRSRKRTDKYHI